jgi:uncharacterized protein YecE (DUF72 family)
VARYFSTIEINSTYYGSPLPATADKWVARVAPFPNFKFTAKLWARYDYLYTRDELAPWAARAREVASVASETYVVTNNHYKGKAVANAAMLEALVGKPPAKVPPQLIKTYPKALRGLAKPG